MNGSYHTLCKMFKNIVASSAEYEIASDFANGQDTTVIRCVLIEMDHPQLPSPKKVDNTTEISFINGTMKEKQTKSIDMKCHWLKDRQNQKGFQCH